MATALSVWYTTTDQHYYVAPLETMNGPRIVAFSETISTTDIDSVGDVFNLVRLPQSSKVIAFYYELSDLDDSETNSDLDFELVETYNSTTTTTEVYAPGTLGQAAVTGDWVLPAVDKVYIRECGPTDSGEIDFRLYQNVSRTATAGTISGFIIYE